MSEDFVKVSLGRKLGGGFFFFGGVFMFFAAVWDADGASFGPAIFNLVIGTPIFWPVLKNWMNKIPFPNK